MGNLNVPNMYIVAVSAEKKLERHNVRATELFSWQKEKKRETETFTMVDNLRCCQERYRNMSSTCY